MWRERFSANYFFPLTEKSTKLNQLLEKAYTFPNPNMFYSIFSTRFFLTACVISATHTHTPPQATTEAALRSCSEPVAIDLRTDC